MLLLVSGLVLEARAQRLESRPHTPFAICLLVEIIQHPSNLSGGFEACRTSPAMSVEQGVMVVGAVLPFMAASPLFMAAASPFVAVVLLCMATALSFMAAALPFIDAALTYKGAEQTTRWRTGWTSRAERCCGALRRAGR
eukprot:1049907-Rhodomonas_salina.1